MVVYEKIYFEVYTNNQYIWHKNNIAQLYLFKNKQYFGYPCFEFVVMSPLGSETRVGSLIWTW